MNERVSGKKNAAGRRSNDCNKKRTAATTCAGTDVCRYEAAKNGKCRKENIIKM